LYTHTQFAGRSCSWLVRPGRLFLEIRQIGDDRKLVGMASNVDSLNDVGNGELLERHVDCPLVVLGPAVGVLALVGCQSGQLHRAGQHGLHKAAQGHSIRESG